MNTTSRRMNTRGRRGDFDTVNRYGNRSDQYQDTNVVRYNLHSYTKNDATNSASLNMVQTSNIPNVISLEVASFNQFISLLLTNARKELVIVNTEQAPDAILVENSLIILNDEDRMLS